MELRLCRVAFRISSKGAKVERGLWQARIVAGIIHGLCLEGWCADQVFTGSPILQALEEVEVSVFWEVGHPKEVLQQVLRNHPLRKFHRGVVFTHGVSADPADIHTIVWLLRCLQDVMASNPGGPQQYNGYYRMNTAPNPSQSSGHCAWGTGWQPSQRPRHRATS